MALAAQAGHLRSRGVGGQHGGLAVEGLDLAGDGEVLIGDGPAGDLYWRTRVFQPSECPSADQPVPAGAISSLMLFKAV